MGRSVSAIEGERFGRLIAVRQIFPHQAGTASRWLCRCDCGTEKVVRIDAFKSGRQLSCGCHRREKIKAALTSHGLSHLAEYHIWLGMLARCTNPKSTGWEAYGGRGITVCDRWRLGEGGQGGFVLFLADVGFRPSPEMSIDRIDNARGYERGNVRWATREVQSNNRRTNRIVIYRGQEITLTQAVRSAGSVVTYSAAAVRLKKGWAVEDAVETPGRRSLN